MKTLLHKTSDRIIVSIAAVFILTAPLFYLITRYFYTEDMIDIIESIERGEGLPPSFDLDHSTRVISSPRRKRCMCDMATSSIGCVCRVAL